MDLVIVESPTKAKTLSRFLGSGYKVEASMGHIRDLPQKGGGLAIDIEHDFAPKYEVIADKKKRITELKKLAANAETIYLAPDPDREGEAIAYHVEFLLKGKGDESRFKRVTFHEITKTAIDEALKNPGHVNMQLVEAQQARRVLDRLVGYTLSPVLWKKIRRGLSAGRVQSVALRLVVEREREIQNFKPEEYWEIFVDLQAKEDKLTVQLVKISGKTAKIENTAEANKVTDDLNKASYLVSDVSSQEQKSSPNPPFTTSLLQRAASNQLGWSAKQTMAHAQALYENGFITYHRTDSFNLAVEAVTALRSYIKTEYGDAYLPDAPRYYKTTSKSAQEAHEAIRPTDPKRLSSQIEGGKLGPKHQKLYDLIWRRFVQCQMTDARFDKTTIMVETADKVYSLKAEGKRMIFDGWMRLGKPAEDVFVPTVTGGEALQLIKVDPQQKFTQPPARYSEAGLIKELEKRGIGRPSTYASIISTIQDRMYVTKEEKRFVPTAVGMTVTDFLVENFGNIMAYDFTAGMEDDLDAIAEGKKNWVGVVREFWNPLEKKVGTVETEAKRVAVPTESTGEKCPQCQEGDVVIRTGRFGKFYSCSRYPECKYTKQYVEYAEGHVCPEDGGRVVIKKSKKGKFFGCENYPKCKWAAWKLPKKGE